MKAMKSSTLLGVRRFSQRSFPASFARGGTSNGLVIRRADLPSEGQWPGMLPSAMGSPDIYGRQLNGMGSGISSTSKIVVLGPPSRPDVDVDYTFVQVGVRDGTLDMAGNCGNMSSLVGPCAWDQGFVQQQKTAVDDQGTWGVVRMLNTNTNKVMVSRFKVTGDPLAYDHTGDYVMDGVDGKGSPITLSFLDPEGAKTGKALPTGNPVDVLDIGDGVHASLVDIGNPGVFVTAESLGLPDNLTPADVEDDLALKKRLAAIRAAGTVKMGLDPTVESVPKIVLLFPKRGTEDIRCLAMSMGQAHKAVPLTLALCLGASAGIQGTLAWEMTRGKQGVVTIAHPSGSVDVGTEMDGGTVKEVKLLRTGRILMTGDVFY